MSEIPNPEIHINMGRPLDEAAGATMPVVEQVGNVQITRRAESVTVPSEVVARDVGDVALDGSFERDIESDIAPDAETASADSYMAVGIDRSSPEGIEETVDEIVAYADHNGWEGMTWTKGEDSRRVEGVRQNSQGRWDVFIQRFDKDGNKVGGPTPYPVARMTEKFKNDIGDGYMKEVRIRNNSEQQAEGKIPRLGRDNSGKAIELH